MANTDVSAVIDQLAQATVEDSGELNFAGRGLKLDSEEDAKEITDEIKKCKNLTALRLEGNTLGVDAAKAIAKALEAHPEFQKALWKDMFTGRLKSEIPDALTFLSGGIILAGARLVSLDLSDNAFGPVGVQGIKVLLESKSFYKMQELRLNNNGLGISGGKILAKALLTCHKSSVVDGSPLSLRVFVSGRNRLENEGAKALAEVFKAMGSLEELSMPQNGICHAGISALAKALSRNKNLKVLNLNDNTFTEVGAVAMSRVIPDLIHLQTLNFGDCLVRSEGARALTMALKAGHRNLKEVHLGFNEINREVGMYIVNSLKDRPSLYRLDLDGNKFGDEGRDDMRAAMQEAERLGVLSSLSEDEGEDESEDDEDKEKDEEEDEEEEPEEISEILSPEKLTTNTSLTPHSVIDPVQTSVDEFLSAPSAARLLGLGKSRSHLITQEIGENASFEKYIEVFLKLGSCVGAADDTVKEMACECADQVMAQVFKQAEEKDRLAVLSNYLLVHLGLIKSEEKNFKPMNDLLGPLILLEHVVRQPYFSRVTKEILQLFLSRMFLDSRPNKAVEACGSAKHKLMQSLYRF